MTKETAMNIPAIIVSGLSDAGLNEAHARLKRTRKRGWVFGLNGRTAILPRKDALALVAGEVKARSAKAAS